MLTSFQINSKVQKVSELFLNMVMDKNVKNTLNKNMSGSISSTRKKSAFLKQISVRKCGERDC